MYIVLLNSVTAMTADDGPVRWRWCWLAVSPWAR